MLLLSALASGRIPGHQEQHQPKEEHRKMVGKLASRWRRSLLAALAVGIVVLGGALGAGRASAAGIPAFAQRQGNVIEPSYYVAPSGQRLSPAQIAAGGAAAAAALPVYKLGPGQEGYLDDSHECRDIGNQGGVHGIECSDVYAVGISNTSVNVYAGGEGNCQSADGYVRCPAVKFVAELANAPVPGVADVAESGIADCGGSSPQQCNVGRNFFTITNDGFNVSGCNSAPGKGYEFWAEVLPATIIAVPGSHNIQATGNFGSAHVIVCSVD